AVYALLPLSLLVGLRLHAHVAILPAPARLAYELALALDLAADGLAVRDLRLPDVRLGLELAVHAIDDGLQVQLAHAGDDRRSGLLVGMHTERGVFLGEALQR